MTARVVPMPVLLAAAIVLLGQLPGGVGPVVAQGMHAPQQRFAQLRRPGDEGGDPTEPGGLPGRSERSEDTRPMTSRGIKHHKKATSDKDKSKTEDRGKKDQR